MKANDVTMAGASGRERQSLGKKITGWLSKVFELNTAGLNWPRGVMILDVVLVPLIVFWAIGHEQYLLSAVFGALFTALIDPGGSYWHSAWRSGVFALIGAGLTALAFSIGGSAWGWLVLAGFAVTLVAGLAVILGIRQFIAALLLNVWFVVALALAVSLHQKSHITNHTWAQVVAWAGGSALWLVVTFVEWLIRRRQDRPAPVPEFPGDTSPRKLTGPLIMFAVFRALGIAGAIAIAYGLNLSHAEWVPIGTIVAMKPSLGETTVIAAQRVTGALIGAGAAALLLLLPANETGAKLVSITHGLEVVAIVLFMHAAAIRFWNYAVYQGAIAAGVLILMDLPQPSNYSAEEDRILWTLCGVGIGVFVMLAAGLLSKLAATKAQPASSTA